MLLLPWGLVILPPVLQVCPPCILNNKVVDATSRAHLILDEVYSSNAGKDVLALKEGFSGDAIGISVGIGGEVLGFDKVGNKQVAVGH